MKDYMKLSIETNESFTKLALNYSANICMRSLLYLENSIKKEK